jgi:hypothetical protein
MEKKTKEKREREKRKLFFCSRIEQKEIRKERERSVSRLQACQLIGACVLGET